jgi:hypothetical protein
VGIRRFRLLGLDGRCEVFWVSGGGGGGTNKIGRGKSFMKTLVSLKRLFSLKSYFEDSE